MAKKLSKILLIELMIVAIIFVYFTSKNLKHRNSITNSMVIKTEDETYQTLDIDKPKLYLELESALLEGKEKVDIKKFALFKEPEAIFKVLEDVSNSNPEVMYYKGAEYRLGSLNLSYSIPKEEMEKHQSKIRLIKDEIIETNIKLNMTDYEKVLAIHDYIINNSRYDERLFISGSVPPESYSVYGILSLGIGVCEGYAKSMKYLLDAVGIESIIVIGQSKGENHAWNLVNLEGEYYHIDATWDDPVTTDGSNILRYNFFNLKDEEIRKTHSWKKEDYPLAKGEKYNYFRYNNLIVSGRESLNEMIKGTLLEKNGKLLLKVKGFDLKDIALGDMIENIAYNNYEEIKLKRYSYSIDEEYGIISFEFFY